MSDRVRTLVDHYRDIGAKRMAGLPIVNPALDVEAVAFEASDGHEAGILISPWFMNLVVLPGTADWNEAGQGDRVEWTLPGGVLDLTVCRDEQCGTYLTAALFRTVVDFPDQDTARAVAEEIAASLRREPGEDTGSSGRRLSRRQLFTRLGAS